MSNGKWPDFSGADRRVTVFGWSRTAPGTPLWESAEEVGRLLAEHGFSVWSGGYGGSMEAVSKGARKVIDKRGGMRSSEVVGVVVSDIFPDRQRQGNPYLTETRESTGMLHRIDQLMCGSRYFVILPGTMGTLQELCSVWMQKVLHPAELPAPVIIAFEDPWRACTKGLVDSLSLPAHQGELIHFVRNPEEVINIILADDAKRQRQFGASKL